MRKRVGKHGGPRFGPRRENPGSWSIPEASDWSGIGEVRLRELAKRPDFPCVQIGRHRKMIPREAFIKWFNTTFVEIAATD